MKTRLITCLLIMSCTLATTWAQQSLTLIKLKGDQQFAGSVIREDQSSLTLQTLYLGSMEIALNLVKSREILDTNYNVEVTLKDQSRLTGIFLGMDSDTLLVRNDLLTNKKIPLTSVVSLRFVMRSEGIISSVSNPNATRYFFAPSAIPIKKGEGYYQNAYLLVNSANFGITENISIGGGVVIPMLFYITPKVSFKVANKWHAGAGLLYTTTFIPGLNFGAGIPYGLVTYGNGERNITLGSGYGLLWSDGEMDIPKYPISTLNSMYRLSRKVQLITENWIIPTEENVYELVEVIDQYGNKFLTEEVTGTRTAVYMAISFGSRFVFSEKASVDFAPVLLYTGQDYLVLPYLDFVYRF